MLVLERKNNETWLQAALRMAKPYGLEYEVEDDYHIFIQDGETESEAAYMACEQWDVLEFEPNETNKGESNGS